MSEEYQVNWLTGEWRKYLEQSNNIPEGFDDAMDDFFMKMNECPEIVTMYSELSVIIDKNLENIFNLKKGGIR